MITPKHGRGSEGVAPGLRSEEFGGGARGRHLGDAELAVVPGTGAGRTDPDGDALTIWSSATADAAPQRWQTVLLTTLALTWLNPHVYLDTVITMGAIANGHGYGKWAFAFGACIASVLWFTALGGGARRLSGFFASPQAWKMLDAVVAVIMLGMAIALFASI